MVTINRYSCMTIYVKICSDIFFFIVESLSECVSYHVPPLVFDYNDSINITIFEGGRDSEREFHEFCHS